MLRPLVPNAVRLLKSRPHLERTGLDPHQFNLHPLTQIHGKRTLGLGRPPQYHTPAPGLRWLKTTPADGSHIVNVSNNDACDKSPAWSPDGNKLAFVSNRDGDWEIYTFTRWKPTARIHPSRCLRHVACGCNNSCGGRSERVAVPALPPRLAISGS